MQVTIVGGGIAGLCSAWALVAAGHGVTLIEQGPIPNPLAASGDHHRIIRRAYAPDSGYGHAITEAFEAWDALWRDIGSVHYDPRGFMAVSRAPGDEAERYLEGMRAGGWPFERLDGAAAAARFAFLAPDSFRYAFVSPEGGALHCRRIAADLVAWLRQRGAEILDHTRVVAVDGAAGTVRLADGGQRGADRVLVTAGAWTTQLVPALAATLAPHRTAVVYLEPPADLVAAWATAPVILDVGGPTDGYIIPPSGGAGLKFGSGLHKEPTADADRDRAPRPGEGEAVRDLFAPPIARIGEYRVADVVTCAYTFTADERFFCAERGRALVVSACSGHGYKFGAAVGRRVARALDGGDTGALAAWLAGG
ncbi:FAD-dependent oxidoreductase [Aquibium sp. A9E412]|uniref:NAD(P)/FAD-dependent oxidoreductase n=1 Tax=Aquibium sp. A9E412 TaxID=2976767 RepID=UPI0025AFBA30|nr:FAD-dependent oxidoreductase [Aquibium sp. A9E412]MDN2564913.1 FAD-dependent oxidoreductase [Aquibium sp. A9E412]